MKTTIDNIRIPANHVLVLVDKDYETLQLKGRETGILVSNHTMENGKVMSVKERHYSVYGTVYAVPEKIKFNRDKIKHYTDNYNFITRVNGENKLTDSSVFEEIARLRKESCLFDTQNELEVGDKIKFSYQAHKEAHEAGKIIDTDLGKMYFIKYDMIFLSVNEDHSPKRMVNGYILVEPDVNETKKDGIMDYTESASGIVIPSLKKKENRSRKKITGKVILSGKKINGYLQFPELTDPSIDFSPGDFLLFDPRGCKRLEHHYHQEYSDKDLYLIQRRDIYLSQKENIIFDKKTIQEMV